MNQLVSNLAISHIATVQTVLEMLMFAIPSVLASRWLKWFVAPLAFSLVAACGGGDDHNPAAQQKSIVATAQGDANLSTLVSVLTFASDNGDLVNTLSGTGTFTVFAPTNAAFDALAVELTGSAAARAGDLLTAANKPLLRSVLLNHVLGAKVERAQVPAGKPITPLGGTYFKIEAVGSGLQITDGRGRKGSIVATDVQATNGVVHVIDKVILPADKNIVQIAQGNPAFSILVEAVVAAGLAPTLSTGTFTVFAPTDAAFAALLTELNLTKAQLLANTPLLTAVLTYHAVPARVLKADVPVATPIATVQGGTFTVASNLAITDGRARTSNITTTDIFATNGVVHVIDKVILPRP